MDNMSYHEIRRYEKYLWAGRKSTFSDLSSKVSYNEMHV
jgi:hypothetical protein